MHAAGNAFETMSEVSEIDIEKVIRNLIDKAFKVHLERYTTEILSDPRGGVNWLGFMHRVKVTGCKKDGERAEYHLIFKLAPYQPLFRKVFPIRDAYECEIYTYTRIITEYLKIQDERGVENVFNPFVKVYASTMEDCREALLMDDMKVKGFQNYNYQLSVDYNHASFMMRALGKFHALSYAIQDQKPEIFAKWKSSCVESFFNSSNLFDSVTNMMTTLSEEILKTYNDADSVRETFQRSIKRIRAVFKGLIDLDSFGKHIVIGYGDFQVRNVLFKYQNSLEQRTPTDICLLDFQCLRVGSPAYDISYFISTCTDHKLREKYYAQLIKDYYHSLSSFLKELGSDPEVIFPYEVLLDHLKRFAVFGMYIGIWLVALDQKPTDNLPDVHNAADEEVLANYLSVVPNEEYIHRMRDLISDYIGYGYDI